VVVVVVVVKQIEFPTPGKTTGRILALQFFLVFFLEFVF